MDCPRTQVLCSSGKHRTIEISSTENRRIRLFRSHEGFFLFLSFLLLDERQDKKSCIQCGRTLVQALPFYMWSNVLLSWTVGKWDKGRMMREKQNLREDQSRLQLGGFQISKFLLYGFILWPPREKYSHLVIVEKVIRYNNLNKDIYLKIQKKCEPLFFLWSSVTLKGFSESVNESIRPGFWREQSQLFVHSHLVIVGRMIWFHAKDVHINKLSLVSPTQKEQISIYFYREEH